jgi:hypothetical protein
MRQRFGLMLLLGLLTLPFAVSAEQVLMPRRAVEAAADAAPAPVTGLFDVQVRSAGHDADGVYLNTEADYRDQRNLTVAMSLTIAARLTQQYGQAPEEFFRNKHLIVSGQAQRVKVWFLSDGHVTDKYYFQTHVDVTDPAQLQLAN